MAHSSGINELDQKLTSLQVAQQLISDNILAKAAAKTCFFVNTVVIPFISLVLNELDFTAESLSVSQLSIFWTYLARFKLQNQKHLKNPCCVPTSLESKSKALKANSVGRGQSGPTSMLKSIEEIKP